MGWRFLTDVEAVWYKLIIFRHASDLDALCGNESNWGLSKASLWWRDIRMVCGPKLLGNSWFLESISCRLGDEAFFRFWDDCWLGPMPLKILFPLLYEVSDSHSVKVANMRLWTDNGWVWDVGMDTNVLVGVLQEDWFELLDILKDISPFLDRLDRVV